MEELLTAQTTDSEQTAAPSIPSIAAEENTAEYVAESLPQSKEDNARFARERREREQRERLRKAELKGKTDGVLATVGTNPYTGESITDELDAEEYLAMKEIDERGGNPVSDYVKERKEALRLERKGAPQQAWYENDAKDFAEKYPDVDKKALFEDGIFRDFAMKAVGALPMTKIYADYLELCGRLTEKAAADAETRLAREVAKAKASPGTLTDSHSDFEPFSKERLREMSIEDIERNYERVMRSIKR